MVVKMQLPVGAEAAQVPALVYSQSRKVKFTVPVTDELRAVMGRDVRAFFRAKKLGKSSFKLICRVPDRTW